MTFTTAAGFEKPAIDPGRSQIPNGVQDRFLVEAVRRRQAEAVLRECFIRWGYQEVIPPTFEYYENMSVGASERLRQAMYRFIDRKGRTLSLRSDFTPQIARMAATKLYDRPMPLRCFYVGSLFRYEEPQAGRKREFTQAGVELIGANTAEADAEVVAQAIAALEALNLEGFQINLGQMAFFHALTRDLAAGALDAVREAIDHKNSARLEAGLDQAGLDGPRRELLRCLPELVGGPEVLEEAQVLAKDLGSRGALASLERLAQVYGLLQAYGSADCVIIDLGEVRGMDYYTGITFRGVAPSLGWPLISGGRYDDLIAGFGRSMAAVGFGLGIERALLVQPHQDSLSASPHLSVQGCHHAACLDMVQKLRKLGCRVAVDVRGMGPAELAEHARQSGVSRMLRCSGEGWLLIDEGGERALTSDELLQEAGNWPLPYGDELKGRVL